MAGEKHQIRCGKIDWSRISESAERRGMSRSELLITAFNAHEERERECIRLPDVAASKPLSTGDDILAHLTLARGDEDEARVTMRATREEWAKAIDIIPGLRAEMDRRWGKKAS
jgi:hypothetical protein